MDSGKIKKSLRRTWMPFFGHFGDLLPIQELVIPRVLEKDNVVVISPAASGKTESVIAPVIENLLEKETADTLASKLLVLYVSPTRALVNDLYRRLRDPVEYLGLTIGIKTGDRPQLTAKKIPNVLLTTPESFDSLLARHPAFFLEIGAVILDEIHLLDNAPRGDQLRILLNRLQKIKGGVQYCILSATIDDLAIGDRYFSPSKVCLLRMPREIEYFLLEAKRFVPKLMELARERRLKKILVFFNARSLAELYSQKLDVPPFTGLVHVHHASLPKVKREEVEQAMNTSDRAILCATSTLELGIDIGSVDCVVLFRPPFNVSSLLQRIGRGNRRTQALFAVGIFTNGWERSLFNTFFDCAREGTFYEKRYTPALSVIPQQVYSYLHQRRRIGTTVRSLASILFPVFGEDKVRAVFGHLHECGNIEESRPGVYYNSSRLEKKIEWGRIHSNIAETSFGEYDVFSETLGTHVGRIFHLRERFVLGGKCWQVSQIIEKDKKVFARCIGDAPAVTKIFEGKGAGSYNFRLAPVIKSRYIPDLGLDEFPCVVEGQDTHILHLFGSLYGFIWADALFREGVDAMDVEGRLLVLKGYVPSGERFPMPSKDAVNKVLHDNIRRLEDALGSGSFFYDLPPEYQVEDHFLNMDLEGFLNFLAGLRLVCMNPEDFRRLLGEFGPDA
ncbi:MAG: DEAD/DEAH box helicase [candidate division WOR-3 bacterium]|nr:MAG: DEAD/DEAH box helicase [candidate division WOR-3 bacterium]